MLAAGLLHDVVEKSEIEIADVRERFGDVVGDLVDALTEDETIDDYEERKDEHRQRVAAADPAALAIFAADKLTNVAMLREAYALIGEGVSDELAVPLDLKIYIWEADLEMLFERGSGDGADGRIRRSRWSASWGDRFRAVGSPPDLLTEAAPQGQQVPEGHEHRERARRW